MKYAIPLIGNRVAPRCIYSDGLIQVTVSRGGRFRSRRSRMVIRSAVELVAELRAANIDKVICGGVSNQVREMLLSEQIEVIDNVTGTVEEVINLIREGWLPNPNLPGRAATAQGVPAALETRSNGPLSAVDNVVESRDQLAESPLDFHCLACSDRVCLRGESCLVLPYSYANSLNVEERRILEAAIDISHEEPRRLCRLAELVYFCLEMNYHRVGIAFCVDMWEPAQILNEVLGRFFEVISVCCKVGGISESELFDPADSVAEQSDTTIACNPLGQAQVLNLADTQFNVAVGLCVGVDTIFSMACDVPTSTLFVKDKSLAHNPIGALYSEYYLRESAPKSPNVHPPRNPRKDLS